MLALALFAVSTPSAVPFVDQIGNKTAGWLVVFLTVLIIGFLFWDRREMKKRDEKKESEHKKQLKDQRESHRAMLNDCQSEKSETTRRFIESLESSQKEIARVVGENSSVARENIEQLKETRELTNKLWRKLESQTKS